MPEIAEVARIVHFLNLHLAGKTIKSVTAPDDPIVFGKVGTTGSQIVAALTGRKVVSAGNQGKYFWLVLDRPPHPVMHFGMTGWIHIEGQRTQYKSYYNKLKEGEGDQWPPRFWKFHLAAEDPTVRVAFTDPRRLGRVRLVDCPGEKIRQHSPLVENGPDPVVDTSIFTKDFLRQKMKSRHVPIKALLLDQTTVSGIGNWVGDEVLYHARLHPEQYCNEFDDEQIGSLYDSIRYVCQLAVDKLGDPDEFPEDWLFHYRWGSRKGMPSGHLPNGEKLAFLKVGGRTSCYAPGLQRKSGHITSGVKEEPIESDAEGQGTKKARNKVKKEMRAGGSDEEEERRQQPQKKRRRADVDNTETKKSTKRSAPQPPKVEEGLRRSGRLGGKTT